jgi:dihydrofolate synthase/folylpolyglutamate synthase
LARIEALLDRLNNPQEAFLVIHVAGTNGKGSVAAMITAALAAQGLRVGTYVSPDLGRPNERVLINQAPISEDLWDALAEEIEVAGQDISPAPTWFETVTALGFLAFQRMRVDAAVVEVGMGGRLDATNIVPSPKLTVITPIALDHIHFLGDTVEAIAAEKAGILKRGSELVLSRQPFSAAREVVCRIAERQGVPVFEPRAYAQPGPDGVRLIASDEKEVFAPLLGAYQTTNLETAWTAVERLWELGLIRDLDAARQGIGSVKWAGRFQVISQNPWVVVDGAHNLHGVEGLASTLSMAPWNACRWHIVFGVLADKAGDDMAEVLAGLAVRLTLTSVPGERGRDPRTLAMAPRSGLTIDVVADPAAAVRQARLGLEPGEGLLVTGSLSLLAYLMTEGVFRGGPQPLSIGDG